jgi:transketolase
VTGEEHTVHGGLGGAVAEYCLEAGVIPKAFRRVGLRDGFSAIVGSQDYLRQQYGMDERAIVDAAKHVVAASARTSVGVAG